MLMNFKQAIFFKDERDKIYFEALTWYKKGVKQRLICVQFQWEGNSKDATIKFEISFDWEIGPLEKYFRKVDILICYNLFKILHTSQNFYFLTIGILIQKTFLLWNYGNNENHSHWRVWEVHICMFLKYFSNFSCCWRLQGG